MLYFRYNVQNTCNQLGLWRFKPNPRQRGQQIAFTPRYKRIERNLPAWPDHDKEEQADYDTQVENHPKIIDLHYFTLEEARECVDHYIKYHKKIETPEVLITTGRGNNSTSKNTIKKQTIKQLKKQNVTFQVNPRNK